jgi:hypothetical protein
VVQQLIAGNALAIRDSPQQSIGVAPNHCSPPSSVIAQKGSGVLQGKHGVSRLD